MAVSLFAAGIAGGPASASASSRSRASAGGRPKAASFLAGAGVESITPPAPGSAADQQFGVGSAPACAANPSHGRFGLQEPFTDLNGNLQWDDQPPEPFCDANGNGRWDGIYADNGKGPASGVHDPLEVRAFAISDGRDRPVVYASVDQIGIFDYYTEAARADLRNTYNVAADLVVSADHNESSPDSIGLYGAYSEFEGIGIRSGINEYFMRFLADRIARAAADAVHALKPANLYANQVEGAIPTATSGSHYPLLKNMSERISDQFPTSVALPHDDRVAAVDPKLGVLQARALARGRHRRDGPPIFTVMSLAAHNQEMGNAGAQLSADWPGAFERTYDAAHAGTAIFLVADNGSEEDPQTNPPVIKNGSENHSDPVTQYIQAQATGAQFARLTANAAQAAQPLRPGAVTLARKQICVPLENNGFVALAAAGEFGQRQGYICDAKGNPQSAIPNGSVTPTASTKFRTFIGYADVGPDLQLLDIPGEAFPALMLGSPFGVEDESCPRPNPAVPVWRANAEYRFQVGLADDLTGYLIPAWGFASDTPGLFNNDSCYQDMHGHRHKLESESVGPTGANDLANGLSQMLGAHPDHTAHIVSGRFIAADGSLSRWATGAVAALIEPGNVIIGAPRTAGLAGRAVDETGLFMDYDGQPQRAPDVTTRGVMVLDRRGCVSARYYLNVFPDVQQTPALGRLRRERAVLPPRACASAALQPLAAATARLPLTKADANLARKAGPFSVHHPRRACRGRLRPPRLLIVRGRRGLHGRAIAGSCGRRRARIARVTVQAGSGPQLLARGTSRWSLRAARGRYLIRAFDTDGLEVTRAT